jgi:hypothetical protein
MGRALVLAIAFALVASAVQASQSPKAMVRGVYDKLIAASATGGAYDPSGEVPLSSRLARLEAAARRRAGDDVPCGLDFDIWFDGQEYDIKHADVIEAPGATGIWRMIVARFDSLGKPHEVHFVFRRFLGQWRLDDAESVKGTRWVFSRLLRCEA